MMSNCLSSRLVFLCILSLSLCSLPHVMAASDSNSVDITWLGHSTIELSTPDYKKVVFLDPWIENPAWGWFNVTPPYQYASIANLVEYIKEKNPTIVLILLTCDHGDHVGDLFRLTNELINASIQVRIVAIYEVAYSYVSPMFGEQGEQIVVNFGAGINIGGSILIEGIKITMTDARHSSSENKIGAPAVGYVIEMNGLKFYDAGATALFGDMQLINELYSPDVAFLPIGDVITMGPKEAAYAVKYVQPKMAIPVHYATSPILRGPEAAIEFSNYVRDSTPSVAVKILKPGEMFRYSGSTSTPESINWAMYVSLGILIAVVCVVTVLRLKIRRRASRTSVSSATKHASAKSTISWKA